MATFDGTKCKLTIDAALSGINDEISGFPTGSMFKAELTEAAFKSIPRVGGITRIATGRKDGTVLIRLARESRFNAVLSSIHTTDKLTGGQVFNINCDDLSSDGSFFRGKDAYITKAPPFEASNEDAPVLEWMLDVSELEINHAGHSSW